MTWTGGSNPGYSIPKGAKEAQDIIEAKKMNFARGNVFKAAWRVGDKPGVDELYDWEKIEFFAKREIARIKKELANAK